MDFQRVVLHRDHKDTVEVRFEPLESRWAVLLWNNGSSSLVGRHTCRHRKKWTCS